MRFFSLYAIDERRERSTSHDAGLPHGPFVYLLRTS